MKNYAIYNPTGNPLWNVHSAGFSCAHGGKKSVTNRKDGQRDSRHNSNIFVEHSSRRKAKGLIKSLRESVLQEMNICHVVEEEQETPKYWFSFTARAVILSLGGNLKTPGEEPARSVFKIITLCGNISHNFFPGNWLFSGSYVGKKILLLAYAVHIYRLKTRPSNSMIQSTPILTKREVLHLPAVNAIKPNAIPVPFQFSEQ